MADAAALFRGQPYTDDLRPMVVEPVVLEGTLVRLEPLSRAHLDGLCAVGFEPAVWNLVTVSVTNRDEMGEWVDAALADQAAGTALPFATVLRETGQVVGSSRYLNIDRRNRHVEIGWTWIALPWQHSGVNTEAKLLQLEHAFERLRCLRVEFKTDSLNAQSRAALAAIGATEEGTFRNHMISQAGRLRHSVWFSITDTEWPSVRARLEERLARHLAARGA